MNKKINILEVHKAVKNLIETKTELKCYDDVPLNIKGDFFMLQCIGKQDNSTKTMYVEGFIFYIHCIHHSKRSVGVYELINKLEEALTEDITLPDDYLLVNQIEDGILQILTEEKTKEKRAVIQYTFKICYGFKCK